MIDAGAHWIPVIRCGQRSSAGPVRCPARSDADVDLRREHRSRHHAGQTADVIVVAPATARVIGSYAAGISDGLLTAALLATRAPVVVCPAMHTEMWEHDAVQHNIEVLRGRGVHMVVPEAGRLAGGDIGTGRLAEPATIFAAVGEVLAGLPERDPADGPLPPQRDFAGVSVTVTAGGTREAIDPVRFIGNRSSGKQGYAIAHAARDRARTSHLIRAPRPRAEGVREVRVESAPRWRLPPGAAEAT